MNAQRWTLTVGLAAGAAVLMKTVPALAHHSSAPFYDATKKVEAQGPVTQVPVQEPALVPVLPGADEKGQAVEWQIELGAGGVADAHRMDAGNAQAGHGHQGEPDSRRAPKARTACAAPGSRAPTAARSSPADA